MGGLTIPLEEKNVVEIARKTERPHTVVAHKDKRFLIVSEHVYSYPLYPSLPYLGIPTPALSLMALGEPMTQEGKERLMSSLGGRTILFSEDTRGNFEVFSYTIAYLQDRKELALGFAYSRLQKGEEEGKPVRRFIDGEWLTGRRGAIEQRLKDKLGQTKEIIKFMMGEEEREIKTLLTKLSFWLAKNTAELLKDKKTREKAHKAEVTASLLTKQALGIKPKSEKEQMYLMQRGYGFLGILKKLVPGEKKSPPRKPQRALMK